MKESICFAATSPAGIDIMNEVIIVLSSSSNASGSEDVKSALIELIKLARTGDRQFVQKIRSLLPNIIETLKHSEVCCAFVYYLLSHRVCQLSYVSHASTFHRQSGAPESCIFKAFFVL